MLVIDYRHYERLALPVYLLTTGLLAATLVLAPVTRGSQSWLFGGRVQPAELAKLSLVLVLARYCHRNPPGDTTRLRDLFWPAAIIALPVGLIIAQRDMGVALLTLLIGATYLPLVRIPWRAWAAVAALALAALAALWTFGLAPYQKERILAVVDPGRDPLASGYQVVANTGLPDALRGIRTVFYLVHSMGGKTLFKNDEYAEKDREAAKNFMAAADASSLQRVIYLGGLGETRDDLSEHLRSRAEIAKILSSGKPSATVLRSAIIIGAGGASFEMLRYLVERLPVMICPKWVETRIQPIAIKDVLTYLVGCLLNPETAGQEFDIGGSEIFTYVEMMQKYAEVRGLAKRFIIRVPVLSPMLSAYRVDLMTPIPSGIAHPLIEGLRNEVVCKDNSIDEFVKIEMTPFKVAVKIAFSEERDGPGITGF